MKIFAKKGILQKTILVILTILLINFIVPTYSHADWGGVLADPFLDFFASIGDAIINLLQRCMMGDWGAGFSISGFQVESDKFFSEDKYANHRTTEIGEEIDVDTKLTRGLFGIGNNYHIPLATYSPEQIFTNNVAGLDINFIDPGFKNQYEKGIPIVDKMDKEGYKLDSDGNRIPLSSAGKLRPTIAKWYVALRNLAIVGLLSVLVYVGIRILISSTASDKAKYKQMFTDWLIALCLLFFLHYIMSFTITLTESITQSIAGTGSDSVVITIKEGGEQKSFKTNLLGAARFKIQYKDFGDKMAFFILYIALVIYTVMFTWTYLKRMLMMAFLTIIAPLVALTYPIDKISDGQAQAFNTWLKEYIFNALLQPFHLIIYIVFVGSAMDLAQTNIIYVIAAMGFILPAEKILRNIFGFNKAGAGTVGALTGFAAGNLANKFLKGKGGGSSGKASGQKNTPEGDKPPRFEKKHDVAAIEGVEGSDRNNNNVVEDKLEENENYNNANPFAEQSNNDLDEQSIDDRMAELENSDYNYAYNPEYLDLQQRKQQMEAGNAKSQEQQAKEGQQDNSDEKISFGQGFNNWRRYHNITARGIAGGTWKGIKGVAKFGTKTAFKAGVGTLAAAVTAASGGGLAGAAAAFTTGATLGGRIGDKVTQIPGAVSRIPSAIGRELDIAHGNTEHQDARAFKDFKKDENNIQYLKDKMTAENGGVVPSNKEVRERMNDLDPYMKEGLNDIKEMLRAQKAEQYGISSKQAAIIAAIGKERGITADILNDDKKAKAQQANLKQEFMNKGLSEANATKQADYTMNVLKAQNGVAHNLKKK